MVGSIAFNPLRPPTKSSALNVNDELRPPTFGPHRNLSLLPAGRRHSEKGPGSVCLESGATASIVRHLILVCWEESKARMESRETEPAGAIDLKESNFEHLVYVYMAAKLLRNFFTCL